MWINKDIQVEYEFLKNGGRGFELLGRMEKGLYDF